MDSYFPNLVSCNCDVASLQNWLGTYFLGCHALTLCEKIL